MMNKLQNWLRNTKFIQKMQYLYDLQEKIGTLNYLHKFHLLHDKRYAVAHNALVSEFNESKYFWMKPEKEI